MDDQLNPRLRIVVYALDTYMQQQWGLPSIIITSIYREDDDGVHHFWRGVDIRTKTWASLEMKKDAERFLNEHFQYDIHRNKISTALFHEVYDEEGNSRGEHLHLQSSAIRDAWA